MAKYVYPAIFTAEKKGGYSVIFPDVEGCFTGGDNMNEALEMAEDALCLMLYNYELDDEKFKKNVSAPSDIKSFKLADNETVSFVHCDTMYYRRYFDSKSVKKTLSIPNWMNIQAEKAGINFSQVLQEALSEKLANA